MKNPEVVIMGLGYIGLPTAALIASKNIKVLGVDVNPEVVKTINEGKVHIKEPDLEGLVKVVVEKRYLFASTEPKSAQVFIIAVPTPVKKDFAPDISFIEKAVDMIIPYLQKENLLILESTSPIGTTEYIANYIYRLKSNLKSKLFIAYCPERVLPGKILYELEHNDRIIGGIDKLSAIKAKEFYSLFVKGNIYLTNAKTAEMCKLVENAYRDLNIAFANEISIICDKVGINVWELIALANKHPRVNILNPGVGVGGHCIAIDPWFIISSFKEAKLMKTAREVNLVKTEWVLNKIKQKAQEFQKKYLRVPVIACMGLTYKADVDDLRESPALYIAKKLYSQNFNILFVDPNLDNLPGYTLTDIKEALSISDIIVFLVAHRQFKNLNLKHLKNKIVLDFTGCIIS